MMNKRYFNHHFTSFPNFVLKMKCCFFKWCLTWNIFYHSECLLDCTLWDALVAEFLERYNNRTDFGPFVLIINHARVKEAQGTYHIHVCLVWYIRTKLLLHFTGIYPLQLSSVWNGTNFILCIRKTWSAYLTILQTFWKDLNFVVLILQSAILW
jgi:hypothetical protein